MKKLVLAIVVLGVLTSGASAVNMAGKIGLGVGWSTDYCYDLCPSIAITRIGLLSRLVLTPIVEAKIVRESWKYNETSHSETAYDIVFTPTVDFALLAHSKTNVYVRGGVSVSIYGESNTDDISSSYYGIKVGFGLEHFVSEYFAVVLSTMSGISYYSYEDYKETLFSISNRVVELGLVWYH